MIILCETRKLVAEEGSDLPTIIQQLLRRGGRTHAGVKGITLQDQGRLLALGGVGAGGVIPIPSSLLTRQERL